MNNHLSTNLPAVTSAPTDGFGMLAEAADFSIQGERLKFAKGEFVKGKQEGVLPLGTRLEAHATAEAWLKFVNNELVEQVLHKSGEQFPERQDLGDNNESEWELGLDGRPKDPWTLCAYIYFIEASGTRDFTFIGSSFGARKAVYGLARQVVLKRRSHPGAVPVIQLGVTSWMSKKFGKIAAPQFTVVGWVGVPKEQQSLVDELADNIPF